MLEESTYNRISDGLSTVAEALTHVNPQQLIITKEQAEEIMKEILEDIPENCRCLLPEDDALAVIAYAQSYYMRRFL